MPEEFGEFEERRSRLDLTCSFIWHHPRCFVLLWWAFFSLLPFLIGLVLGAWIF